MHIHFISRFFAVFLFSIIASLSSHAVANSTGNQAIAQALKNSQSGDLIFRSGIGPLSEIVRRIEGKGDNYTHVGMLFKSSSGWKVIHAVPSEDDSRADGVVIDGIDFFLDPSRADKVSIYRVKTEQTHINQAIAFAKAEVGKGFSFESVMNAPPSPLIFSNKSQETYYCTEFILSAYNRSTPIINASTTPVSMGLFTGKYFLPSDLIKTQNLKHISSFRISK